MYDSMTMIAVTSIVIAGITTGFGTMGPALGEGRAVAAALSALAQRQGQLLLMAIVARQVDAPGAVQRQGREVCVAAHRRARFEQLKPAVGRRPVHLDEVLRVIVDLQQ